METRDSKEKCLVSFREQKVKIPNQDPEQKHTTQKHRI